jgi:hypothetical protein
MPTLQGRIPGFDAIYSRRGEEFLSFAFWVLRFACCASTRLAWDVRRAFVLQAVVGLRSCTTGVATDYRLVATGWWLLATGYWLLATGYWLLATGYWLLATGYWLLATG